MTRRTACLAALAAFALTVAAPAGATAADEPSIHGTWVGYLKVADFKVKLTTTLKADGSYKVIMDNSGFVSVEKGKFTYSDGVLETEPTGGVNGTFTVKWEDRNTMIVKGGGYTITYKRQ